MTVHVAAMDGDAGYSLLKALRHTGVTVLYQDSDLKVVWAHNLPAAWSGEDVAGLTDADFLPREAAERMAAAKLTVLSSGRKQTLEIRVSAQDGVRWFDVWIDADRGSDGDGTRGLITTAVETTEQKRREQTLRALLREVSHRSKNLLAIIQSVATQTGRYTDTLDGFLERFRGRLQSLASSQDLVTMSNWRGADLRELVMGQVGRYSADPGRAVRISGANPYLNPNAALHIGLALHELAINSMTFGALSKPDGVVDISASLQTPDAPPAGLVLDWSESIEPQPDISPEKRFGSVALERVVPAALNGKGQFRVGRDKISYTLLVPHGNFAID
ncbi:MAG: HWE histidine kinase domain-containing protein [Mesorhizobium sp.]|jgi:two-component sensor histidine kinase